MRTFDTVLYTVKTDLQNLGSLSEIPLVYDFTLPDNAELTMGDVGTIPDVTHNTDGTVTYSYNITMSASNASAGEIIKEFPVNVGNLANGAEIKPTISVRLANDETTRQQVSNVSPVHVTCTPAYNIVLGTNNFMDVGVAYRDFGDGSRIPGVRQFYGFALEVARLNHSIKGASFPTGAQDFKFTIDIGSYTLTNGAEVKDLTVAGFVPRFYEVNENNPGGAQIGNIPFTKQYTNTDGRYCDNSGALTIAPQTGDPTKLDVTVSGTVIDRTKFPQYSASSGTGQQTYWTEATKILEGVFSSWRFVVVYPYENDSHETLLDKYPNGGTIGVKASIVGDSDNLTVTSGSDTTTTSETNFNDNSVDRTWPLDPTGNCTHGIWYAKRYPADWGQGYNPNSQRSDNDVAAAGADDLAFTVNYLQNPIGEYYETQTPTTITQLVLLDRNALQNVSLDRTSASSYGYDCTIQYGVYNGTDNYPTESAMRSVSQSNFNFTDALPSDGLCDAILLTFTRSTDWTTRLGDNTALKLYTRFNAKVRPDTADHTVSGKVYMLTLVSDAVHDDTSLHHIDNRGSYSIPQYDNEGVYHAQDPYNFNTAYADALYVVPYLAKVTKVVAQQQNGATRQNYYFQYGERYVDYRISSALEYKATTTVPVSGTTTLTLVDTLPKGMYYVANSARWGGTYTDNNAQQPGLVADGTPFEPTATQNADGNTVLTWTIPDVPKTGVELPCLYYTCKLGDELDPSKEVQTSGVALTNTVGIHTTEDKRDFNAESGNYSTASVTPYKSSQFYILKTGGPWLELNDTTYYDLTIANNSTVAKTDLVVVDALPYTTAGYQANGNYTLKSLTLNLTALGGANDFKVFYTEAESKKGLTSTALNRTELSTSADWHKLNYTVTDVSGYQMANFTLPDGGIRPTAIVYLDESLAANTVARLHMDFNVTGEVGDFLHNSMTTPGANNANLTATAETKVVSRTLEGTVWEDTDKNGQLNAGEKKLGGVHVTLLRKNETTGEFEPAELFKDKNGNPYPNESDTDENGQYRFVGLPAGQYRVKFTSGTTDLGGYDVTQPTAGAEETSSKVQPGGVDKAQGKLQSATITDIEAAPTMAEMQADGTTSWAKLYQNVGLILQPTQPAPVTPATPTPTPSATPAPSATPTPTPSATPAPSATPTPTPSATPAPSSQPAAPTSAPAQEESPAQPTATPAAVQKPAATQPTPAPTQVQTRIPKTADNQPLLLWVTLALSALGGMAVLTAIRRKKQ